MVTRLACLGLVAILAIAVIGCNPPPTCATDMPARLTNTGTSPTNIFKQLIPTNPALAPNSAAIISRQLSIMDSAHTEVHFGFDEWSAPVYYTDASTPRNTYVQLLSSYCDGYPADGGATSCGPIRWKSCMTGGQCSDAPIVIIDTVDRCNYEGWGWNGCAIGSTPRAWWVGALPLDDANQLWDPYEGLGGTAGGTLGGGVWPDELTMAALDHGLAFATDWLVNNPSRIAAPLWHCDGRGTHEDDLFQGMRVQLNPSYDISGLPTYKRVVAQAMKDFGMYDMNSNIGHWAIGGPNPAGYTNNCWSGVLPQAVVDAKYFKVVPVAQFRVLAVSAWNTPPAGAIIGNNSCLSYAGTSAGAAPTITTISPTSGAAGTTVSLTGTSMSNGYNVRFDDTVATNMVVRSSTLVTCTVPTIPTGAGTVTVSYRTTTGGLSNLKNFSYTGGSGSAPTLSSINPTSGTTAGGTVCTLTGTNLTGTTGVSFGGTAGTSIVNVSSTSVRATSPAKAAGTVSVTATTANGTSNGVNYTYNAPAPTLSAIAPTSGTTAGGTICTLTGTNLTGTTGVSFGGTAGTSIVNVSSTSVRATSPAKSAGTISVTATTSGGTSNGVNYTYTTGGTSYTNTVAASADAYLSISSPSTNYGNGVLMAQYNAAPVDLRPVMKFSLSSVQGTTITSAKLRMNWYNANAQTLGIWTVSNDTWVESTVSWNVGGITTPVSQIASLVLNGTPGWFETDVTSYVNSQFGGDKVVSLMCRSTANVNSQANSKENASYAPSLVIISQ